MARRDNILKTVGSTYYALLPGRDEVCAVTIVELTERTVLVKMTDDPTTAYGSPIPHKAVRFATDDVNFLETITRD